MWKIFTLSNKKGITLVETLFSAVIIALVIGGVLLVFVHTVDMSKRINYEYAATNIAKSWIERIKSAIETSGFASITQANFGESYTKLDSNGGPDPNGNFRRSTTVNDTYGTRLTRVTVEVEYRYRGEWETDSPIVMNTLFPDIS